MALEPLYRAQADTQETVNINRYKAGTLAELFETVRKSEIIARIDQILQAKPEPLEFQNWLKEKKRI